MVGPRSDSTPLLSVSVTVCARALRPSKYSAETRCASEGDIDIEHVSGFLAHGVYRLLFVREELIEIALCLQRHVRQPVACKANIGKRFEQSQRAHDRNEIGDINRQQIARADGAGKCMWAERGV